MLKQLMIIKCFLATLASSLLLGMVGGAYAQSIVATVTNINDSGPGSLRQAITDANAGGLCGSTATINFNIPVPGPVVISLNSPLPTLSCNDTTLDGYSQPLATANKQLTGNNANILITLNGASLGMAGPGLEINANNIAVRGLAINNFAGNPGVLIAGGNGATITGNSISSNGFGVKMTGGSMANIGGLLAAERNTISSNSVGILLPFVSGATGTRIVNNYIGVSPSGAIGSPNGGNNAIEIYVPNTVIANNLIAGNLGAGIGMLRGPADIHDNTINANLQGGIRVYASECAPQGISIRANNIGIPNGAYPGIALGDILAGDVRDSNALLNSPGCYHANGGQPGSPAFAQNYPIITAVNYAWSGASVATTVDATLSSAASTTYDIDLFDNTNNIDTSNLGIGVKYVLTGKKITDGVGYTAIQMITSGPPTYHPSMTASTPVGSIGGTSEISVQAVTPLIYTSTYSNFSIAAGGTQSQTFTFTNADSVAVMVPLPTSNSAAFTVTSSTCGSVAAGASCQVVVTYNQPSPTVTETATLTLGPISSASPPVLPETVKPAVSYVFALNGAASAPAAGPAVTVSGATTFPSTAVGGSSAVQAVTIQNSGTANLTFSLAHSNAALFRDSYFDDTRPIPYNWCFIGADVNGAPLTGMQTLSPGSSCTLQLIFKPTVLGLTSATLTMISNATPSTSVITLSGTGVAGNVPSAPGAPNANAANGYAMVSFSPSTNTGFSNTGYTVVSSPAGGYDSNAGSAITSHIVTGLTNGTAYTFTVVANNGVGNSTSSVVSNSVMPATPAFVLPAAVSQNGLLAYFPFTVAASDLMGGASFSLNPSATFASNSLSMNGVYSGSNSSGLREGVNYRQFSFMVDFNLSTLPTNGTILSFGTSYRAMELGVTPLYEPRITLNNGVSSFTLGAPMTLNTWHRAIVVVDVSKLTINLYIDGVLKTPISLPSGFNFDAFYSSANPSDRVFSFFNYANGGAFNGLANNLLIYGRALSGAEALSLNSLIAAPGLATSPAITSATPPGGSIGKGYSFSFTAAGSPTITWSIATGTMPTGLSLNTTTGVLSGTPTLAGSYSFTVQAANGTLPNASATYTVVITPLAAPLFSASAGILTFSGQGVGTSSAPQALTLTNTGTADLIFGGAFTLTGPFTTTTSCSTSLLAVPPASPPANTCTINVTFTPTVAGAATGTLTITDNTVSSPHIIALSGTGINLNPTMTVAVSPASVLAGINAQVTLTLSTPAPSPQLISSGSVTMPAGLLVQATPAPSNNCGTFPSIVTGGTGITFGMGSISAMGSCTITFAVRAASAGSYTINVVPSNLSAGGNNTNTSSVALIVAPALAPGITVSTGGLSFGAVNVGVSSAAQNITITSSGQLPLAINNISSQGDFAFSSNCPLSPATLAVGATCNISVTFNPLGTGSSNTFLLISSNAPPSSVAVSVSGSGVVVPAPNIAVSPAVLAFGDQSVGSVSAIQSVIVTNGGSANLLLSGVVINGAGLVRASAPTTTIPAITVPNCGTTLAPLAQCHISVLFAPAVTGAVNGSITITHNVTAPSTPNPLTVAITANGTPAPAPIIKLSGNLSFTEQVIGTVSAPQVITISNTGNAPLNLDAIIVQPGANTLANDFALSGTCAATLAANASCSFNISFTPQLATSLNPATKTAVVSIPSNASNAAIVNAITVTGMAMPIPSPIAKLSATTLGFGNVIYGSLAPAQRVTLTNVGNLPLNLASITTDSSYSQTNTCGTVLAPNAFCTISITFSPISLGTIAGKLVINSNAPSSPDKVLLSGKGCRYFSPAAARFFLTSC